MAVRRALLAATPESVSAHLICVSLTPLGFLPQVGGFMAVRRALLATLSDAAYNTVQSFHSDSAVCFSLFLHHLPDLAAPEQHPPHVLLRALEVGCAYTERKSCSKLACRQLACAY